MSPNNNDEVPTDETAPDRTNESPADSTDRTNESPADSTDRTNESLANQTTEPHADAPTDESPAARPASLTAVVVKRKGGLDECTLSPADADNEALVTEWITAEEGSYVELDSMR